MDKAEKYDRQIRLWGAQGQERIEGASVVCLGASAVMTETLKNLILPGTSSGTLETVWLIEGVKEWARIPLQMVRKSKTKT